MAEAAQDLEYYKVRVNTVFEAANVIFRPDVDYHVSPTIYADADFKAKCVSAVPVYARK